MAYAFTPGNNLPELVFDAIISYLSFKDVLTCAQVCRRWMDYVRKHPRRRMATLGQEVNCHGPLSDQFAAAHFSDITDIKTVTAVPLFVANKCVDAEVNLCNLPMGFIKKLLRHGSRLTSLDLSSMKPGHYKTAEILRILQYCQIKTLSVRSN